MCQAEAATELDKAPAPNCNQQDQAVALTYLSWQGEKAKWGLEKATHLKSLKMQ